MGLPEAQVTAIAAQAFARLRRGSQEDPSTRHAHCFYVIRADALGRILGPGSGVGCGGAAGAYPV